MPFFLDTQETVERFGGSVAEVCSLLDANHVRHGSPNDFFAFTSTLEGNSQFRLDMSALVKSIASRERGELLLTDMMGIIAAAVGGISLAETTADITKPSNTLMEFLLGTGCWNWKHFGSTSRSLTPRPTPSSVPIAEPEPIVISHLASPVRSDAGMPEDETSLLAISKELRQTLSRLENNTQQVKLHLDSIEQRIGTMGSTPKSDSDQKMAGLEPLLHRGPADIAVPDAARLPVREVSSIDLPLPTRGRAVFSGSTFLGESGAEEDDNDFSPTFAYGSEKRSSIFPVLIFLALVVIGVAIFFFVRSTRGHAALQAGLGRLEGSQSRLGTSAVPTSSAPPSTDATSPASTASTSIGADASSGTPPLADRHNTATVPPATAPSSEDTGARLLSSDPAIRYVPANVMEGYLLSAPRPEYPADARRDRVEGQVVLQAIISRSGAVRALHAVKGPASLRGAAVGAVRTWRYRPYSVDGRAQDVATTVYVDFTLKPPPTLVH